MPLTPLALALALADIILVNAESAADGAIEQMTRRDLDSETDAEG